MRQEEIGSKLRSGLDNLVLNLARTEFRVAEHLDPVHAFTFAHIRTMKRSHHCNFLTADNLGHAVSLAGWVDSVRDHGGLIFVDLRDREGITQVVFEGHDPRFVDLVPQIKPESVIGVSGRVVRRPEGTVNPLLRTGEIDVQAEQIEVYNVAQTPPFPLDESAERVQEDLRLQYRYLDLRRRPALAALRLRSRAAKAVRDFLDGEGFIEVETPTLFKSTPEGAREFLVPCRQHPGQFYALPQSPQQFKQMLMVAGVERYYQLARCFRDEDMRADRQPEFTQIDLEMSFIDREDMYALVEGMLARIWKACLDIEIPLPFPRMSYQEAMNRFGVDKPDTRFGLELVDFTEDFRGSGFKLFAGAAEGGQVVKAINARGLADVTQGEMKGLEDIARELGAKGLAYIRVANGEWKSPILKFLSDAEKETLRQRLDIKDGDLVLFAVDGWERACAILGRLRLEAAQLLIRRERMSLRPDQWNFLWVVDFPLMVPDEEQGRYVSAHHPFTAPVDEDVPLLKTDPKAVRGQHYDIVLNGVELGGGSIRIHQPKRQKMVFEEVLKIPPDVVESRFGYMLRAFQFGAPPHGGIALGFDRLVTLLAGRTSIRDVIAFPKTQKGQCLMTQSPGAVTTRQLRDVHVQVTALE